MTRRPEYNSVMPSRIYWHRELPPRRAEAVAAHTLEAVSDRVHGTQQRPGICSSFLIPGRVTEFRQTRRRQCGVICDMR
jgi:hypothetical protein